MAWGARNLISTQAHRRPNAAQWSGCDRSKALGLQSVPRASIHIKTHRRRLLDEDAFAHSMRVADFCLVMCCVEINQCVGCTSFLGDDAAVLARSSDEEPAPPRHRAGVASMAWRTTR